MLAVLVVILVAAVASFSVFRWIASDDTQDFQGTWYVAGTDTPVVITEDRIQLNDEVSYWYELNTDSKTITFTFGNLEGEGCYRFSLDKQQLVVVDGTYGWWDTLISDAEWTIGALVSLAQGSQLSPVEDGVDDVTSLTRTPASGVVGDAASGDGTLIGGDAASGDAALGDSGLSDGTASNDGVASSSSAGASSSAAAS